MGIGPREGVLLGANFGERHCSQWELYGAAVSGGVCGGPRHCCKLIRWGRHRARGRGGFGGFVHHFDNGKCHWVADGEMFPIGTVCENLTTFPFGKRIVGKLDSCAFWRYIQFQDQRWGL